MTGRRPVLTAVRLVELTAFDLVDHAQADFCRTDFRVSISN
jgi:hypothetical protein